ncbi:MAG: ribonuclease H [Halomonas sp.]|nr:ribonuclease H [Halomonas sp.]MDM7481679.1 ribonuclease H [Halomonas sp.]
MFCDGACDPNPGPSGSGVVVYRQGMLSDLYYGHFAPMGTNNTAELLALQESLFLAKTALSESKSVRIRPDSQYAIKCISQWASGWKKRGWRRPNNEPVKNQAIVEAAYNLYNEIGHAIELVHVKAHAGIKGNELADRMAMKASVERQGAFVKYQGTLDTQEILRLERG